jgi:hypothetical protein
VRHTDLARARGGLAAALLLAALPLPVSAATLARGGQTTLRVVVPADAIPPEMAAAQELVSYLERATSARFPLVTEERVEGDAPAIWVGPTARSRAVGFDTEALGAEEWRIRTVGDDLILVVGRPRGTLYAVYRFLEDHAGVRWWNPFEEHVPYRPDLEVEVDAAGRPAFAYRDVQGVRGPAVFHARSRANGHFSFLTPVYGGSERYGLPFMVHTFFQYLPPEVYFAAHPEFYSERDGERIGERTQLCLANDALLDVVTGKLEEYIERSRTEAAAEGQVPPRLFSFSQNDWPRPCTCEGCRALDKREKSHSGSLVRFINRLAESVARTHPDVLLDTLAYDYTLRPPHSLSLRDNVVVRFADLQYRDFSKPVTHRANREVRRALEGWRERTSHLRVWCYTVTFGHEPNNLPLPNLKVIAEDFRYYLEQGVEGLFIQHEHPVHADMRDLKSWVIFKLAEEPERDLDRLVVDFTNGYYGLAARTVREYLQLLEQAVRRKPSPIRHPTHYEQYRYLTPAILRRAHSLFDRAEQEVAGDPVLVRRLRHARLALDRATLLLWEDELAEPSRRGGSGERLDPRVIAERYRETAYEQIGIRIGMRRQGEMRALVDDEIAEALAGIGD